MSANKGCRIAKAGLLIAAFAMQITFAGTLPSGPSFRQKDLGAFAGLNMKHIPDAMQQYVPGEVIVKLRDEQDSRAFLLYEPYSAIVPRREAALLRLQAEYGLHDGVPVFKGLHQRLERQDIDDSEIQGHVGVSSEDRLTESARRSMNVDFLRFYMLRTEYDVRNVCDRLKNDPDVEYAQPNYIYQICGEPNDPDFPDQYAHQLIQMSDAWDISTGSRDVVVAVLDTGVDINHPDLKDNIWVNKDEIPNNGLDDDNNGYVDDVYGWNFGDSNNKVKPEAGDFSSIVGHGTQVAGVIAARGNNGKGVAGINWQCSIMPLRLSVDITSAEVAAALDYINPI